MFHISNVFWGFSPHKSKTMQKHTAASTPGTVWIHQQHANKKEMDVFKIHLPLLKQTIVLLVRAFSSFLRVLDRILELYVKRCIYSQLKMSAGQTFHQHDTENPGTNKEQHANIRKHIITYIYICDMYHRVLLISMHRQAGGQTERQTSRQTDRQAGRQAGRQTHRQADRQTDMQTDR